jgi:hypothetical protein
MPAPGLSHVMPGAGLELLAIVGIVLFAVALVLVTWLAWREGGCLGCLWVWLSVFSNAEWAGRSRSRGTSMSASGSVAGSKAPTRNPTAEATPAPEATSAPSTGAALSREPGGN